MNIGQVELTKGQAKICVSLLGESKEVLLEEIKQLNKQKVDLVEWRCDYFKQSDNALEVVNAAKDLKQALDHIPMIFTFRSLSEGGHKSIPIPEKVSLYKTMMLSKLVDAVDIELFSGDLLVEKIIKHAKMVDCKVIVSNHDFEATPPLDIIDARIAMMKEKGADIVKVAYMPRSEEDVEVVSNAIKNNQNFGPLLGISMGALGVRTRTQASKLGSCMSFAYNQEASAPGQVSVEELYLSINKHEN